MKASDAVKGFVDEKLGKLDRYDRKAKEAHVILSAEKNHTEAEVIISAKGLRATGKASTTDMYASIEQAIVKVEHALKKYHDKKVKSKRHAGANDALLG